MIAREWKCICPRETLEGFIDYLRRTGVKDTSALPGFKGHHILKRSLEDCVEVVLVTFWESHEHIRAFAGEDIAQAVLYPEDQAYAIAPEREVRHYEVVETALA